MKTTLAFVIAAAVSLASLTPGSARADDDKKTAAPPPSEEASQRFRSGVAFYKDKDFAAALVEFKRAYELVPNYSVLYNLGQTGRELKDYAAALKAFEQYLDEGGAKVAAARHKEVAAAIDELKHKVGTLTITSNVDGAAIVLDDVAIGVAPLAAPLVANVGRHKLSATSTGYTPTQRVVEVAGMTETPVALDLTKIEVAPVVVVERPAPVKVGTPVIVWVMLSTTVAAGVAAGVTGGLALSARGGLKDALAAFPGNPTTITAAQGKTRTLAITTDVLGGITLAGAVTTVVLYAISPKTAAATEKAKVTVQVAPTGLVLRGVF
ncbi:MAG: PEGA domain-containing protein [Byssovorax sp.]